jgi:hypothetical protein
MKKNELNKVMHEAVEGKKSFESNRDHLEEKYHVINNILII